MQKKLLLAIILPFFLFACAKKLEPYILSKIPRIQEFEKEDHKFCASLKLTFNKEDNAKSKLYWRCRLSMTKFRINTNNNTQEKIKDNLEIEDLISKISLKVASSPETVIMRQNKKLDNIQHNQCLLMGFKFDSLEQEKVDDYFACRRSLIDDYQLVPPFGNKNYLKYKNYSYNLNYAIGQRIDDQIKKFNEAKKNYPKCIEKYHILTNNFQRCATAYDKSSKCFKKIKRKRYIKENEEKTQCQKKSYIRFPNRFIKQENDRQKEIDRMRTNSDFYNKNNLSAIGITDITEFMSDKKEIDKIEEKVKEKTKEKQDINSKNELYTKFEITKLRQKYIHFCQKDKDKVIKKYVKTLEESCEFLKIFEEE